MSLKRSKKKEKFKRNDTTGISQTKKEKKTEALSYCLYARKSTESDEKQALSIDSQIKEMLEIARKRKLNIAAVKQESHSAKASGQRPVFNKMIEEIKKGRFNAILTWAPDRLSRNAGDLGSLVDLMDEGTLKEIRTFNQTFTDSPNEKFLLMILGSQAKLENDNKSVNVKRGLRAVVEKGLWPSVAPIGYLNSKRRDQKGVVLVDHKRAPVVKKIFEKAGNHHWSGRKIYKWLKNDLDFRSRNGNHISLSSIYRILKNPFYTGTFEYPKESGNWYEGQHKPLISKSLFQKVQDWLTRKNITHSERKEFAFTKLMKYGLCGSGITADEKLKTLKDGTVKRYVYYGCTKSKDLDCDNGYIREKDLIKEFIRLIDEINLDQIGMKEQIEKEIKRYKEFRTGVLGVEKEKATNKKVNIRNYAKYLLKEGSIYEKRELLSCLESRLILKKGEVNLKG